MEEHFSQIGAMYDQLLDGIAFGGRHFQELRYQAFHRIAGELELKGSRLA
jgi:hypothetical protein